MTVTVWLYTTPAASRSRNQDRALLADRIVEQTGEVEQHRLDTPVLVGVFDGLGGHPAGDVASDLAAAIVSGAEPPTGPEDAAGLLVRAHEALIAAADRDQHLTGMGTTAVLSIVGDGDALVANVGDSTAWHLSGGAMTEVSTSDRSGFGLLQCLGGFDDEAGITTHTNLIALAPGDRLLLASDGLTDVVAPATIKDVLADGTAAGTQRLVEAVKEAGLPDDLTVVVVEVDG